jgi:hypothetical protein
MSTAAARGPEVAATEELYRGITHPSWWVAEEGRISSAAFSFPTFSVDVASIAGSPSHTLGHLPPCSGLVAFNCGQARSLSFDARQEIDPDHPQNLAHAHIYSDLPNKQRKKKAQALVQLCKVVTAPTFPVA